jgi:hypothetical protein
MISRVVVQGDYVAQRLWKSSRQMYFTDRRVTLILPGKGGTGPQCISPEGNVPHTSRLEPPPRRYDPAGPDGEDHWRKACREKCMVSVPRVCWRSGIIHSPRACTLAPPPSLLALPSPSQPEPEQAPHTWAPYPARSATDLALPKSACKLKHSPLLTYFPIFFHTRAYQS